MITTVSLVELSTQSGIPQSVLHSLVRKYNWPVRATQMDGKASGFPPHYIDCLRRMRILIRQGYQWPSLIAEQQAKECAPTIERSELDQVIDQQAMCIRRLSVALAVPASVYWTSEGAAERAACLRSVQACALARSQSRPLAANNGQRPGP